MTNLEVARVFDEIADLLEIRGEDFFRINSYRRVARTVADLAADINDVAARGELQSLPGVGKASADKIHELLATGRMQFRESLGEAVPPALLELLRIPHLGPKKVALLWQKCGVTSLDDLKTCLQAGALAGVKGFGPKSIQQITEGIDFLQRTAGRTRIGAAWPVAEAIRELVTRIEGVQRVEHAGSLRRGSDTVGDLDLLCVAADGERVIQEFTRIPISHQVLAAGGTKGSLLVEYRPKRSIQVDLRVVPAESFGAAWQYFTGSKAHNVRLREMAVRRGWTLNEYALSEGDRVIASREEHDIYAAMGLPYYPPELREDRGEFDLKDIPPDLISVEHIRGDLHMHTIASDGRATAEEMVEAARARGYEYICITDHSPSSAIANGLSPERLAVHIESVRRLSAKTPDLAVWIGAEVDILPDGRLDYADEILAQLDFVVASVHQGMGADLETNTRRVLAAIRNPYVNLIAHPTGRLINRREPMALDIEAVAREAARTGTALEINASAYRLDLKDQHARLARDLGAVICIDTDAHTTHELDGISYGILTARRAGLTTQNVLNAWAAPKVRKFVSAKRERK